MYNIIIDTFRIPPTRIKSRLTVQQLSLLKFKNILSTAHVENLIHLTFKLIFRSSQINNFVLIDTINIFDFISHPNDLF